MKSRIVVIVLNWNGQEDTLACLKSLEGARGQFEVLVVDNGSTDDSIKAIKQAFPEVNLIELAENTGFAAGNNTGIKKALGMGAKKVVLLNNDTEVSANLIESLDKISDPENVGLAGPLVYYFSNRSRIWPSAGKYYPWIANFVGAKTIEQATKLRPEQISFLSGCCVLIKKELIAKIGLLDEDFFAYFEDTDYSLRAKSAGFDLKIATDTKVYHKVSQATGGRYSDIYTYLFNRNNLLFAKKHLNWWHWPVFAGYFLVWRVVRIIPRAKLKYVMLGAINFFRGELGKPYFIK